MSCGSSPVELSPALRDAVAAADAAGHAVKGTTSPNPPVGAVILDSGGNLAGTGGTCPAGGAHAEIAALAEAGDRAAGGTAVVTLEPCNHTGRTGPCSHALVEAGVASVVYVFADPGEQAGGGADYLRQRGVEVTGPLVTADTDLTGVPEFSVEAWLTAQRLGRPRVTVKYAGTLDGFAAATDGTSQWITGEEARARVHLDRSRRDAILVGTGTVAADNPRLTARRPDGSLYDHQPLRVVVGQTSVPEDAAVQPALHLADRDVPTVVERLWEQGVVDLLVEGGPRLTAAFLAAGVVDSVHSYIAPALLGSGIPTVDQHSGMSSTMADITRLVRRDACTLGSDVFINSTRRSPEPGT
ncbi:MAG TPA: bifunctional diaminohydroxyphosphoribosylaminopyrimidine deaminase/5-amino-6-(5-phosphoribosylamino)uracil reductase RibD [Candidatus Corynebacterium avicola]|uniref:Riboflavin biosynthesis protein RibD n=1 Tax=Candidatus Corynebacterium avicola TaxID=2838527 RepID=A0A9D1RQ28_9CORY|nr:bifunctional diaminohydroxyphosphoribosylaminopyrimidine deaminase/5-amino-6-(5-phosphoribosylamino)uracil reductase RibD [Candidatus Corynebacterium avicola]